MSFFQSFASIRYDNNFDQDKRPVIYNTHHLELDDPFTIQNKIDELRVNNFTKNAPRPRIIPDVDLLEQERLQRYGNKTDIGPGTIFDRLRQKDVRMPKKDIYGNIILDPVTHKPVEVIMKYEDMLMNPRGLYFRVQQLLEHRKRVGPVTAAVTEELTFLRTHLESLTDRSPSVDDAISIHSAIEAIDTLSESAGPAPSQDRSEVHRPLQPPPATPAHS